MDNREFHELRDQIKELISKHNSVLETCMKLYVDTDWISHQEWFEVGFLRLRISGGCSAVWRHTGIVYHIQLTLHTDDESTVVSDETTSSLTRVSEVLSNYVFLNNNKALEALVD